jgi:hypothetical protein
VATGDDGLTRAQRDDLPSTLQRSDAHARATYAKTLASAREEYGEGARARRTAMASLKHSYEKVGDHWERKPERGDSDPDAPVRGGRPRDTAGGVDAGASKQHLLALARRLDVRGRSSMSKAQLVEALDKANQRESARSLRS